MDSPCLAALKMGSAISIAPCSYAKERRLIEEIKRELAVGRKVHVFAVYTRKRDVTRRLQHLLLKEGIRLKILAAEVPPAEGGAWYERQLRNEKSVNLGGRRII